MRLYSPQDGWEKVTGRSRYYVILRGHFKSGGEYEKAVSLHREVLCIARNSSDLMWQTQALFGMGLALYPVGNYEAAKDCLEECRNITGTIGNRIGEGAALAGLGDILLHEGEYSRALANHRARLTILRSARGQKDARNLIAEGHALMGMGKAYFGLGAYERAEECHHEHLKISITLNDTLGLGSAAGHLAEIRFKQRGYEKAIELHQQHRRYATRLLDRRGEADARFGEAQALSRLGNNHGAVELCSTAVELYTVIKAPEASQVRRWLIEQGNVINV